MSSFISWKVFSISFTCLFLLSLSSFVYSHPLWCQIINFCVPFLEAINHFYIFLEFIIWCLSPMQEFTSLVVELAFEIEWFSWGSILGWELCISSCFRLWSYSLEPLELGFEGFFQELQQFSSESSMLEIFLLAQILLWCLLAFFPLSEIAVVPTLWWRWGDSPAVSVECWSSVHCGKQAS
jgi:hypothetical protein